MHFFALKRQDLAMDVEIWLTIVGLATISFVIRLSGYILASRLPEGGSWAKGKEAFSGSIIIALVSLIMLGRDDLE